MLFQMASMFEPSSYRFEGPWRQLDFIPEIEKAAGFAMPDLRSPEAESNLVKLIEERSIPLPENANLPRLLDKLCAKYLEPQCTDPTWIVGQPECLSPLAKSYRHPDSGQLVAARAELFVDEREIINTYEEENSPFEQRRKFVAQQGFDRSEQAGSTQPTPQIDESYLAALEAGMPPTGGWGCGIDRLVMLFTGEKRIADTLSFGTLRNVAAVTQNKSSVEGWVIDADQRAYMMEQRAHEQTMQEAPPEQPADLDTLVE